MTPFGTLFIFLFFYLFSCCDFSDHAARQSPPAPQNPSLCHCSVAITSKRKEHETAMPVPRGLNDNFFSLPFRSARQISDHSSRALLDRPRPLEKEKRTGLALVSRHRHSLVYDVVLSGLFSRTRLHSFSTVPWRSEQNGIHPRP